MQELTSLGFPSLLGLDKNISFENVIQCLSELFKQYQKLITLKDDMETRWVWCIKLKNKIYYM